MQATIPTVLAVLFTIITTTGLRSEESAEWKHDSAVLAVCVSPDGKFAATGTERGDVTLWNIKEDSKHQLIEQTDEPVSALVFSRNSKVLAVASAGSVKLCDVADRQVIAELKVKAGSIDSLAFSPSGGQLAGTGRDVPFVIWRLNNRAMTGDLNGETDHGGCIAFLKDGHARVATATNDMIAVIDIRSEKVQPIAQSSHGGWSIDCMKLSPDAQTLALGVSRSVDNRLRSEIHIWDLQKAEFKRVQPVRLGGIPVTLENSEILPPWGYALKGHSGPIWSMAFSPEGNRIASASGSYLTFSFGLKKSGIPDSKRMVFRENLVKVWNLSDRSEVVSHQVHDDSVKSVDFLPDGDRVLSGSLDKTARLLSTKRAVEIEGK